MDNIYYSTKLDSLEKDSILYGLLKKTIDHKNELILDGWNVCILLEGIVEDENDYYYRLLMPYRGIIYSSCVGRIDFLKNKIDDNAYNHIYGLFKMNYEFWINAKTQDIEDEYNKKLIL